MSRKKQYSKQHFYRKKSFLWIVGVTFGLIFAVGVAFRVSPWPGALVVRYVFEKGGAKTLREMEPYAPKTATTVLANQQYKTGDKNALLDVYFPQATPSGTQLPVIIWTHGGAWLSGSKDDAAPYFKLLANAGYTVIAPDYSLAPEKSYPTPVQELNTAYAYVQANAVRFHANMNSIILAGDSAGSQLSAQLAALITNPAYAREVGIVPNLKPTQLKGVVLNCGIYNMAGLTEPSPTAPKIVGWGTDVSVWAYAGTRNFSNPVIQQMSPLYHVTNQFPATYISGGNGDPLTKAQSMPFASKLQSLGVSVTSLFYPDDHQPSLPHEYQFKLDIADGQNALKATLAFIKQRTQ